MSAPNVLLENEGPAEEGPKKSTHSPWASISMILSIELCERLSYYTISGSLRNYLIKAGKPGSDSAAMQACFGTIGWMMCLPGGMLSDKFGLYPIILISAVIYACGTGLMTLASLPPIDSTKLMLFLVASMGLVCIGMGGIKPNIMNFGADQITATDERAERQRGSYFSYFYLAINLGAFPAFLYFVTLATNGQPPAIPQSWGFFAAYSVAAVAMLIATLLFLSGTCLYVKKRPNPPPENEVLVVFRTIFHTARQGSLRAMVALFGWALMPVFVLCSLAASFVPATKVPLTYACLGLGTVSLTLVSITHMDNSFLQPLPAAPEQNSREDGFTIEDVRASLKTIPLILLINTAFNMCYNSMNTVMPVQACQMNCFLGGDLQLNGTFFNIGDALAIVIFAPIFEFFLYPLWAKLQGKDVSLGQKLVTGLIAAAASNAAAAILETLREAAPLMSDRPYSKCGPKDTYMNDISAFYMFIPFSLVGFAEILVNPSMYFYVYVAAPKKVRATIQAFNLVSQGCLSGAFTAAFTLALVPDNLNKGNLNIYYYVNIAIALLGIVLYAMFIRFAGSSRDFVQGGLPAPLNLPESTTSFRTSEVESFSRHPTRRE